MVDPISSQWPSGTQPYDLQWTGVRYLGLVGLVEVSQAQAVVVGTATFNPLPLGCHIHIFMHRLASFLHKGDKGINAAAHPCLTTI